VDGWKFPVISACLPGLTDACSAAVDLLLRGGRAAVFQGIGCVCVCESKFLSLVGVDGGALTSRIG